MKTITLPTSILLAVALAIPGCAESSDPAPADGAAAADAKPETAPETKTDAENAEPAEAAPERTVASGLDVGMRFAAFDILNCDSGEEYCQVCRFGGSPKIMAIGTVDDPEFHEDLKDLQAIVAKYGEDKVKAFAVIADPAEGKLATPMANRDDLLAKSKELRTKLGLTMPVVLPAPKDDGLNPVWEDHYQVTKSRTVMFADSRNNVKYSGVAPENFGELDQAIKAAVES